MSRVFVLVLCVSLSATEAWAGPGTSTDGVGRISIGGGLRWTMNDWFNLKATEAGLPPVSGGDEFVTAPLGFQGMASFGYGAFDWFEICVDVFAGYESFKLDGWAPFASVSYGATIGVRATRYDFPVQGLAPYLGVGSGPLLTTVTSQSAPGTERVLQTWSFNGGAAYKLTDRIGLFVDVRYLLGRAFVADIAGRNIGGVFLSAGVSIFFPPSPKRDLDVPGFPSSRP